jgi:glyoxylase-like metal-dependent hydrolase (beta-lactamase superfamily II)
MGISVDYSRDRAIFCADAVHSPCQIFQPTLSTSSCADPKLANETRKMILAEAADSGRLLVPAHFRGQRCARVRSSSSGYEPLFGA